MQKKYRVDEFLRIDEGVKDILRTAIIKLNKTL